MSNRKAHRGQRNPLTQEQLNQRKALRYYIKVTSHTDTETSEIVNVQPMEAMKLILKNSKGKLVESGYGNGWFLRSTFGVVDSAVPASYAFDGCVLENQFGEGAFQNPSVNDLEEESK